jgi:ACS family glucarate transporter-like MFS transporter
MASGIGSHPTAERPTRVRYWVVFFAVTLAVVTYIDRVSIASAVPFIQHDLGLSRVETGAALSAFAWAYALFEIPGGYLGDWMGPRRVILRIVMWWSFFTAATGWAWNMLSLTVTRFLFGMGEAGCFPNLTKAFTTWLPEEERVRAQGITWLSARWGGAFTPPLVALVMTWVGWRHSFEIFGCIGLVWAVGFWRWYRDDPAQNPKLNRAERELLSRNTAAAGHGDVPWSALVRSPQVWMLCWQYFCLSYGWYFYITWLPTYLREGRHQAIASAALLNILPLFCGGLGNPASVAAGAWLVRRTGSVARARRIISSIGFAGASGFLVLSTEIRDPLLAMIVIGLASFSNDLVMPPSWAAAMDIGGKYAGTVSGAMNMWGNIGGAIAPLVNGFLLTWTNGNWNLTFYVAAAVYLLGIACWAALDPVTPLKEDQFALEQS